MSGRRTRNNCDFCNHPERDYLELQIRAGTLVSNNLDKEQGWAEGSTHRHMRRHAGDFSNDSNTDCPLCTHHERTDIESAILDHRASIIDFAEELGISEEVVSEHMEKHTKPLLQRQADIELIPIALKTAHDSLDRIEKNMNRFDNLFSLHLDRIEEEMHNHPDAVSSKDLDLAIKMHREVRETLSELAKWMDRLKEIDKSESISVISIMQEYFSEKAPDEWRTIRTMLAEAGVMD
tara:strand:- start:1054 stop:1761 length:708 start_codon:yes stop_codon:yes gene_type:complete